MSKRNIFWTNRATREFNSAIKYIRKDSDQNADRAVVKILSKISELSADKTVHRKDPYKKNNDGHYLYFEVLKYRIVYYVMANDVFIIRIRHTSMEPKFY